MRTLFLPLLLLLLVQGCSIHHRQMLALEKYQDSLESMDASFIKDYDSIYLSVVNFKLGLETADFICKEFNSNTMLAGLVSYELIRHNPKCFTDASIAQGKVLRINVSRPSSGKPGVWGSSLETTITYLGDDSVKPITSTTIAYTIEPVGTKDFVIGHVSNLLIRAYMPGKNSPEYDAWRLRYKDYCNSSGSTALCDE